MKKNKLSIFKKIILTLFTFLYIFSSNLVFPVKSFAQEDTPSTWYNQGFTDWYAKVYGEDSPPSEIFGERYTAAQVQWILYSLFSFPINFLGSKVQGAISCLYAFGPGSVFDKAKCIQNTTEVIMEAIKVLGISISMGDSSQINKTPTELVFLDYQSRPISGIKYLSNSLFKFNFISEAQAQGFGFGAVDGLQKYWQGFRDVAYAISVLIVVVFSFMIMFRVKLSPQVVISVQSALPKIFGALILATFSYAIAGFVIDISYVIGGLFSSLMALAGFATNFQEAFNQIVPIGSTNAFGGFYILIWMFIYTILFFLASAWALIGTISGLSVYGFLANILAILMSLWVLILMLWYTIKVPWILLKNLISLFLSIVIAPIQIVIGAIIPAIGFGMWFKKIIAEALVFPLTGLFMFLAWKTLWASFAASTGQSVFAQIGLINTGNQNLWTPPILGSAEDMAGLLWLAVSFVLMTMIPKAVDIMKMLIMGAKFDFGNAIGEASQPLTGALRLSSAVGGVGKEISTGWGFLKSKSDQKINLSSGGGQNGKQWYEE